jgi:hypothetical protein
MEGQGGTAAGTGQGDAGGEAAAAAEGQGTGPDLNSLIADLQQTTHGQEDLRQQMTTMQELLTQRLPEPQAEEAPDPLADIDLSWLDSGDPQLDQQMAQNFKTMVDAAVNARVEQAVQQHVGPLQQSQQEMQRSMEADQLTEEFPEMREPEVARQVIRNAVEAAETFGVPEHADKPWFWRMTYLAGRALDAAHEEEGSEQPQVAHLEGAGGAIPGGGQQVDLLKLIAGGDEGRLGRRALPFGG